jgi:DHA2 family lincomycin resistance protein-like MFS transporter
MTLASADPAGGTDVAGARAAFLTAAIIATIALPLTLLVGRPPAKVLAGSAPTG